MKLVKWSAGRRRTGWRSLREMGGTCLAAAGLCILAALAAFAAGGTAFAADALPVMEYKVLSDAVTLYVQHGGPKVTAKIGNSGTDAWMEADASGTNVLTWILLDNSVSMAEYRERTNQILESLFAEKAASQRYNLCTFTDQLTILCEDTRAASTLGIELDKVQYVERKTFLLEVLGKLMDTVDKSSSTDFVRFIVISDGGDENPNGVTMDETLARLGRTNIPIYSILCGSDSPERRNLAALSRQTHARSWELNKIGHWDMAAILVWEEVPVRVEVAVPGPLRDGASQNVLLEFPDGATAQADVQMPNGDWEPRTDTNSDSDSDSDSEPEPEPEPVVVTEKDGLPVVLMVVLVLLALALIGMGVVIFLMIQSHRDEIQPVRDLVSIGGGQYGGSGGMEIVDQDRHRGGCGKTQTLVNYDNPRMLHLTD